MVEEEVTTKKLLSRLQKIVGEPGVKKSDSKPNQIAVKPKTKDDVVRVIRLAVKEEVPIFPKRAGDWNLEGGPSDSTCIILDMTDMKEISEIDEENLVVTMGPGVVWKDLHSKLSGKNLTTGTYPLRSNSIVGEWVDLGGGGIGSYKYGNSADIVRTMEVVLPNGKIINTGFKNVLSNSSGYNLNGLFVGADSTLGVITEITLKLHPDPEEIRPISYTFSGVKELAEAVRSILKSKTTPMNISFSESNHLQALKSFGREVPDLTGWVMNITLSGQKSVVDHEEKVVDEITGGHQGRKEPNEAAKKLWEERFLDGLAKPKGKTAVSCEVIVPISSLFDMLNGAGSQADNMKLRSVIHGIVTDRSTVLLVVYFVSEENLEEREKTLATFANKIGKLAFDCGGRPAGPDMFTPTSLKKIYGEGISAILDIKTALDPHNIMNPREL